MSEFCRPFIAHKIVSFDQNNESFFVNARKYSRKNIIDTPVLDIPQDEVVRQLMLQREREEAWKATQPAFDKNDFDDDKEYFLVMVVVINHDAALSGMEGGTL